MTEVCAEIIKLVLFNFLFKFNSNISESALVVGKSGLLENSVFWRRRGARNPCRLKTCGWGAGCGGGPWGWSNESENQEHFALDLVCREEQLSTGGPAWLLLPDHSKQVSPASPGSHGSLRSAAFSTCPFPLWLPAYTRWSLFEDRECLFILQHPLHHQISEAW